MTVSKVIDLGREKVTVRELTLAEIKDLFDKVEVSATDGMLNMLTTCSTAKKEQLLARAPSEIQPFVDGLVEVNSSFLGQCRQLNNKDLAESFENLLRQVSLIAFLQSSPPDTEKEPGNTVTAIS